MIKNMIKLICPITKKKEDQEIIKESEDGIYLKCSGCKQIKGYEIGYFSDYFNKQFEKKI